MNFEILSFVYGVFTQGDLSPSVHSNAQSSFQKSLLCVRMSSYTNFCLSSKELILLDLGLEDTLEENAQDILFPSRRNTFTNHSAVRNYQGLFSTKQLWS